jgi:DHA1 family multidrug resistance protein-like MFS transporter
MIRKIFPILALCIFSAMLGIGIIAPLLPLYAEHMGATGIWLGIIFGGFSASRAIVMPVVGRLSDRSGRKLFLSIGLLSYAAISLSYIWAANVSQLTLIRLAHGVASGMVIPIAQAYVGDISPQGEEGKWMGYLNAALFGGIGFGPLLGGVLTEHLGMTPAFSTMSGLNFLAFLGVTFFLPEVSPREMATSSNPSFKQMRTSGVIKGLFSYRLSFAFGRGAFSTFLPILAGVYLGLATSLIGALLATNILLMSLLQGVLGKIADRFNRRLLVILGGITSIVFLALIPLSSSFWQLMCLCALGGISGAISMPAVSALTVDEGRRFGMGSTVALITMAMSIGMAIGPVMGGGIADLANIDSVFYFTAGIVAIGTILFIWFTGQYALRS